MRQRRKAGYQRNNDATTTLIEKLIPKYNEQLQRDMIQECMAVVDGAQDVGILSTPSGDHDSPLLKPWTIRNAHGEPAYYTIKFSDPVIYHIPPLLGHLKRRLKIFREQIAEYVPCYMMNLNRVVLAKFVPPYYDNIGDGIIGKFVLKAGRRMQLSSANVFMPGASQHEPISHGRKTAEMYFEHAWWHFPGASDVRDTSCLHNLVYHSNNRVKQVVRLRKTLLRVLKIGKMETRNILNDGRPVACMHVQVSLLVDNGRTLSSEKRWILMHRSVAEVVKEGHVINAVLAEPDLARPKLSIVMGCVGSPMQISDKAILSTAISIAIWTAMRDGGPESSLTKVGSIEETTERVAETVSNNDGPTKVLEMPWSLSQGDVKRIIDGFRPMYVRTGEWVYHIPPPIASFVLARQPALLDNYSAAYSIARMFDLVEPSVKGCKSKAIYSLIVKAKNEPRWFPNALLAHVPALVGESAMSRMFYFHV